MITHPITTDARAAKEFLESISDRPRGAPWAATFDQWAAARGLDVDLARMTKAAILRLRMFEAAGRTRRGRR